MDSQVTYPKQDRELLEAVAESWLTFWGLMRDELELPQQLAVDATIDMLSSALRVER